MFYDMADNMKAVAVHIVIYDSKIKWYNCLGLPCEVNNQSWLIFDRLAVQSHIWQQLWMAKAAAESIRKHGVILPAGGAININQTTTYILWLISFELFKQVVFCFVLWKVIIAERLKRNILYIRFKSGSWQSFIVVTFYCFGSLSILFLHNDI